jgi:ABC-type transport system involved in multi-copper enzyme maturation permease subunit
MTSILANRVTFGLLLGLVQGVVALPWLMLVLPESPRVWLRRKEFWGVLLGAAAGLGLVLAILPRFLGDETNLQFVGKAYGSLLQAQLTADLFAVFFGLLMAAWPKGGAVALAAFREGVRQPMFWLVVGAVLVLMLIIPFIPYFTFGEDHLMAKDLGLEVIMLFTLVFGALLASMSISEEIEGRTAVTLMSKPVSRRQFLLGKYFGILLACLLLVGSLGWVYCWMMDFKNWYDGASWYDKFNKVEFPSSVNAVIKAWVPLDAGQSLMRGTSLWFMDAGEAIPGLVLGFCHVMVLLAVAVCLATRLPVAANLVTCVVVYVLGHLSPILVQSAQQQSGAAGGGSAVTQMLVFMARGFDRVLPSLQLFSPTRITDVPIPVSQLALYAGEVLGYSVLYTALVLLFGLVLFEDRDLA